MPADSGHSQELNSMNVPATALIPSHDPFSKGKNPSAQTEGPLTPAVGLDEAPDPSFRKC